MANCRTGGVLFAIAVALLLAAGCASSQPPNAAAPEAAQGTNARNSTPGPRHESDKKMVAAYSHFLQGTIADMEDKPDEAMAEFTEATLNDPSNEDLVLELTRRQIQRRKLDDALKVLLRATAIPGASGEIFARLGVVYSELGKNDQAVAVTATAIARAPASFNAYRTLFLIELQRGRPQAAEKVLDRAARAPGTSPDFCAAVAELYASLLRQAPSLTDSIHTNAGAMLDRAIRMQPSSPQVKAKLADGYLAIGDSTNAIHLYQELLGGYGDAPGLREKIRLKIAEVYLEHRDYTNAATQLKAIAADDPGNGQVYYLLGRLALDARNLPEAEDYFHRTLVLTEENQDAYFKLAGVQIDLEKGGEALATLDKAEARFGSGFAISYLRGLACVEQKDYTNAVKQFTSAEVIANSTDPKALSAGFYFDAGAACERKGDYEEAEQYFNKSLALAPDYPEALNYLGYMWADRGVKLEHARELIEKAVLLRPKSAAYQDSLAWVLYRLNKPQEALGCIQQAVKLSERADATIYDHLGDIYTALKEADKAADAWRKSLSVEPNEEIKKKLDRSEAKGKN